MSNIPFLYINVAVLSCFALMFVTILAVKKNTGDLGISGGAAGRYFMGRRLGAHAAADLAGPFLLV